MYIYNQQAETEFAQIDIATLIPKRHVLTVLGYQLSELAEANRLANTVALHKSANLF